MNNKKLFDYKKNRPWAENLQIVMQLGLTMVGCIIFCLFVGYQIDKWLGTRGIFITIFIFLGVIGGAVVTYRQIMDIYKDTDSSKDGQMEQVKKIQKRYCSLAIVFSIFAGIMFFLFDLKPMGKGLLLGTIFSIINFILMAETLGSKIGVTKRKATAFSFLSILLRYGLLAMPIAAAIKLEPFNLWATVFGLFTIQMVILADGIISQVYFSTRKKNSTEKLLWKN